MKYYHDLITEKSFKILQDLRRKFDFILIGGWAIFLYTKALKSKDIDIYLPYYSHIGLRVEEIKKHTQSIEGFEVPIPEILLILKTYTFFQRKNTTKGRKDLIDIFSLLSREIINWQEYKELIKKYNLEEINKKLKELISSTKNLSELNLLNHQLSRLKRKILENL